MLLKRTRNHGCWWSIPLSLLVLLAAVEVVLRLVWQPPSDAIEQVGRAHPFYVVESEHGDVKTYVTNGNPPPADENRSYGDDPRQLSPVRFAMPKPKGTVRMFVLGTSPIYGGLDKCGLNLSSYLSRDLQQARPDLHVEIINSAAQQMDADTLAEILDEIVNFTPDFVLIYVGGAVPSLPAPGSYELFAANPTLFRAAKFMMELRVVQALGEPIAKGIERVVLFSRDMFSHDDEMADVNMEENVRRQSEEALAKGYRRLADIAASSSAHIAFYEVVTDLAGTPPLWSLSSRLLDGEQRAQFKKFLQEGRSELEADHAGQAVELLKQAIAIDPTFAETHYLLGQALRKMNRNEEAYTAFVRARDADASHERMFSEPVKPLHETLATKKQILLNTEQRFRAAAPNGIPGRELFRDITHPTSLGLAILGRIGVEWMLPLLPPGKKEQPLPVPAPLAGVVNPDELAEGSLQSMPPVGPPMATYGAPPPPPQ